MTRLSLLLFAIIYITKIPAILITLTLHEYSKAAISSSLGDPLPKQKGRLTLNPLKHIEPIGAALMLVSGFGWGAPVATSPIFYSNKRRGILQANLTPLLLNAILGAAASLALFALPTSATIGIADFLDTLGNSHAGLTITAEAILTAILYSFIAHLAVLNIKMAIFNLIPVYPMDGARIMSAFAKPSTIFSIQRIETILLFLIVSLAAVGFLNVLLSPLIQLITGVSPLFIFAYGF